MVWQDCFSNLDQELDEIVENLVKLRPVFDFEKKSEMARDIMRKLFSYYENLGNL